MSRAHWPFHRGHFWIVDVGVTGLDARQDFVNGVAMTEVVQGRWNLRSLQWIPLIAPLNQGLGRGRSSALDIWVDQYDERAILVTFNWAFVNRSLGSLWPKPPLVLDLAKILSPRLWESRHPNFETALRRLGVERTGDDHDPLSDVYAMTQALLWLLAYAEKSGLRTVDELIHLHSASDWLYEYVQQGRPVAASEAADSA